MYSKKKKEKNRWTEATRKADFSVFEYFGSTINGD